MEYQRVRGSLTFFNPANGFNEWNHGKKITVTLSTQHHPPGFLEPCEFQQFYPVLSVQNKSGQKVISAEIWSKNASNEIEILAWPEHFFQNFDFGSLNAQMPSGCCQRCSFHTTPGFGIGKSPRRLHHFQATRYINVNHLETNRFFDVLCLLERQVTSRSGQELHHPWTWLISRQYG